MEPMIILPQNDTGMAERVLLAYANRYRYRTGAGWMVWAGTHWTLDRGGTLIEAINATVERCIEAADALDPAGKNSPREQFLKWCSNRQSTKALYAVEQRLRTWRGIVEVDGWDADPFALTHKGGTVDLRNRATRPHAPTDLITHCAPATELFGSTLDGSRWGQFLDEVLPDQELQAYFKRAIGCSIVGRQADHVLFVATGTGRNGKGTIFRALAKALGPYYSAIPSDLLVEKGQKAHPTEKADLAGRRLVVSAEISAGQALDEGLVKDLTGGDRIKARFMNKDFFEFDPSHTLWICCNEKPRIKGTDNGIWRRIKVIPFVTTIPIESIDRWLDDKLEAESDLVLTWAIEGALEYLEHGLGECAAVEEATGDYRQGEDLLAMALDEVCEFGLGMTATVARIHAAIGEWYADNGYRRQAPPIPTLARELTKRGFAADRDNAGRWRKGLQVKAGWGNMEARH